MDLMGVEAIEELTKDRERERERMPPMAAGSPRRPPAGPSTHMGKGTTKRERAQ